MCEERVFTAEDCEQVIAPEYVKLMQLYGGAKQQLKLLTGIKTV